MKYFKRALLLFFIVIAYNAYGQTGNYPIETSGDINYTDLKGGVKNAGRPGLYESGMDGVVQTYRHPGEGSGQPDGKLPLEARITKTHINKFNAADAEKYLRISGLLGPVRLKK